MRNTYFFGTYTAIPTPFTQNGAVNYQQLEKVMLRQIEAKIGIVPCGTTGESPTLTTSEHNHIMSYTVNFVNGRVPVIAGTGSNSTFEAVDFTRYAQQAGANAALIVCPYYNRPTQEGLYQHFTKIARDTGNGYGIPIIIYNIPGRTGVDLLPQTLQRIYESSPNKFVGIKECVGISRVQEIAALKLPNFTIFSGDDANTLEMRK